MSHQTDFVVEAFVRLWLTETELGRGAVNALDGNLEAAIDAVFGALNAGFLKLDSNGQALTSISLCVPPRPPRAPIARLKRH